MASEYCTDCEQIVSTEKEFSIWLFIFLMIFGFIGAFVYLLYYEFMKSGKCPICDGTDFR